MPTSSLGSCFFQLSCVISIWAMLQQQPCLWLAVCPIDLDPDLNLQTWFCSLTLDLPPHNRLTWQSTLLVDPGYCHQTCLTPPHSHTVGVHPLLVKSCLPCHDSQLLDCISLSALAAPLHAAAKLHLSPCSVSIFFATKPENIDLYKKHKKKWSKILQELSTSQHIPLNLRKG